LIAPPLLYAEVTAVCRKLVVQQRFNQADGQHILAQMLSFPIETISHHAMYLRAFELANLYALSRAYDTQYIALAEMQQCEFWTVDQRIVQTVSHQLPFVRWIGEEG
jgi:predicted nucleic acid-binding protein